MSCRHLCCGSQISIDFEHFLSPNPSFLSEAKRVTVNGCSKNTISSHGCSCVRPMYQMISINIVCPKCNFRLTIFDLSSHLFFRKGSISIKSAHLHGGGTQRKLTSYKSLKTKKKARQYDLKNG